MNPIDLIVGQLSRNLEFLKMTVADFTDAELLTRPVAGANHPLWQIGHLSNGETMMVNLIKPGVMPELPAGFSQRFDRNMTKVDDPKQFGVTKQELIDQFTKVRQATIAFVKTLSLQDLDAPGPERLRSRAPTVGDLLLLLVGHVIMHAGQIQVARRKLGKPVLF